MMRLVTFENGLVWYISVGAWSSGVSVMIKVLFGFRTPAKRTIT